MPIMKQELVKPVEKVHVPKIDVSSLDTMDIEDLADTYGRLSEIYEAHMANPVIKQFEEVRSLFLARMSEALEPTDSATVSGAYYDLDVGPAAKAPGSIANLKLLRQLMGDAAFFACAKVTLSDARAYLTPEQLEQVLTPGTKYTVRRDVKPHRRVGV